MYPEGYYNSKSGWSSQSDYYAAYYSGQYDYGGTFRSYHGLTAADAFRPWCSQAPGGGVVDFLRKLFLFISHVILSIAKVAESNLRLEITVLLLFIDKYYPSHSSVFLSR